MTRSARRSDTQKCYDAEAVEGLFEGDSPMDVATPIPTDLGVREHLFSVDDLGRLAASGVVPPEIRTELVDGRLLEMTPPGPPHGACVMRLARAIEGALRGRATVSVQNSFLLSDSTVVMPDVVVLQNREDFYEDCFATAAEALLVVEVGQSTLDYDRHVKLPRYTAAGVHEVWIVDLDGQRIERFRQPSAAGYQLVETLQPGTTVAPDRLTDVQVDVAWVIGKRAE